MANENLARKNEKVKYKLQRDIAAFLAGVIMLTAGGVGLGQYVKSRNDNGILTSDTTNPGVDDEQNNEVLDNKLLEDFDINDENAVNERADEIFALLDEQSTKEFEITKQDIINYIYMINEEYSKMTLPSNDDVKNFEYIQKLVTRLVSILDDNLQVRRQALVMLNEGQELDEEYMKQIDEESKKGAVYVAYFIANSGEFKNLATDFYNLVEKQLNFDKDVDHKQISKDYYKFLTEYNDTDLTSVQNWALLTDGDAKNVLFTMHLTKNQQEELDKNKKRPDQNIMGFEIVKSLGIDTSKLEDCTKANELPFGNQPIPAGKGKTFGESSENEVIEEGGNNVGTVTERTGNGGNVTTNTYTTTGIPATNPENGNPVETTTVHITQKNDGGNPVGTTSVVTVTDPALNTTTTKKSETTTKKETTTAHEDEEMYWEDDLDTNDDLHAKLVNEDDVNEKETPLSNLAIATTVTAAGAVVLSVAKKKKYVDASKTKDKTKTLR